MCVCVCCAFMWSGLKTNKLNQRGNKKWHKNHQPIDQWRFFFISISEGHNNIYFIELVSIDVIHRKSNDRHLEAINFDFDYDLIHCIDSIREYVSFIYSFVEVRVQAKCENINKMGANSVDTIDEVVREE